MTRVSIDTRHKVVILPQQGLSLADILRQTDVSRCASDDAQRNGQGKTKSHTSDMETKPNDSSVHENTRPGMQQNSRECSGLISPNLEKLALEESGLFVQRMEAATRMSVYRQ